MCNFIIGQGKRKGEKCVRDGNYPFQNERYCRRHYRDMVNTLHPVSDTETQESTELRAALNKPKKPKKFQFEEPKNEVKNEVIQLKVTKEPKKIVAKPEPIIEEEEVKPEKWQQTPEETSRYMEILARVKANQATAYIPSRHVQTAPIPIKPKGKIFCK